MTDISTELDSVIPRHQLLDNTAAKHRTDLIHRSGHRVLLTSLQLQLETFISIMGVLLLVAGEKIKISPTFKILTKALAAGAVRSFFVSEYKI